ncbi:MAG: RelA/SpoT family protein [Neisseriaceae bacterium]
MNFPAPSTDYHETTLKSREILFRSALYLSEEEKILLEEACAFAHQAHLTQYRKSGEPYVNHPIAVATEIANWGEDATTLIAALLHDVIEDTGISFSEIQLQFGRQVAEVVNGVSKLEHIAGKDYLEWQAESFRKMLLAVVKDIRVLVVKLADRLHNMRTLGVMRKQKQKRIAKETLEVYSELANRMGMNLVYRELQDLSFKFLYAHRYDVMYRALKGWREEKGEMIESIMRSLSSQLVAFNVEATIKGNEKHLYGIFKKMRAKRLHFSQVLDMYGFIVLVHNVPDCYRAIGALHHLYKPKPGSFKDYIAIPKSNGFQSLQTTLIGSMGLPIEVQVRTYDMDGAAEAGRSHVTKNYSVLSRPSLGFRKRQWLENIKEFQQVNDNAVDFYEDFKKDLFPEDLYVFTPKAKIIVLPKHSTVIDFAYSIHTDLGHHCIGAKVNGVSVSPSYLLNSGDIVNVQTDSQSLPSPNWLRFAASAKATSAIRQKLRTVTGDMAIGEENFLPQDTLEGGAPNTAPLTEKSFRRSKRQKLSPRDNFYLFESCKPFPITTTSALVAWTRPTKLRKKLSLDFVKLTNKVYRALYTVQSFFFTQEGRSAAIFTPVKKLTRDLKPSLQDLQTTSRNMGLGSEKAYRMKLEIKVQSTYKLLAKIDQVLAAKGVSIESVNTSPLATRSEKPLIVLGLELEGLCPLEEVVTTLKQIPQVISVSTK